VLAPRVADVLVGDSKPPVLLRRGHHPLEHAAVRLLGVRAATELPLCIAQAQRESIADALELAGGEDPRTAEGTHLPVEAATGKGGREELAQPPLERRDLAAQVGACEALGALGDRAFRRQRGRVDSVEQFGQDTPSGPLVPGRFYPRNTPAASHNASSAAISGTPPT